MRTLLWTVQIELGQLMYELKPVLQRIAVDKKLFRRQRSIALVFQVGL